MSQMWSREDIGFVVLMKDKPDFNWSEIHLFPEILHVSIMMFANLRLK